MSLSHSASRAPPDSNYDEDIPVDGPILETLGELHLPAIIFGSATFSHFYNSCAYLETSAPLRAVRLALRYGIRAFDTAPLYGPSEILLGKILKALELEFPRSSYQLITKCGRLGDPASDYSPAGIRSSVQTSMQRLGTSYLDVLYLHDVEFVSHDVSSWTGGNSVRAMTDESQRFGLAEGQEGSVRGEGEQKLLDAIAEMRKMQSEGWIRNIGISGYPLPVLLRIALLILHTPPYKPLDVVQSYSHLSLQNTTFKDYAVQFRDRAKVRQLVTASPLNMGLFSHEVPLWHPAPTKLREAVALVRQTHSDWPGGIADMALGYAFRISRQIGGGVPVATGLSTPREVHACMKAWRAVNQGSDAERRVKEKNIISIIDQSGHLDWSWASPQLKA